MDTAKLRKLTKVELIERLETKRNELTEYKAEVKLGKESNFNGIKELKKEIARISTLINIESELGEEKKDKSEE